MAKFTKNFGLILLFALLGFSSLDAQTAKIYGRIQDMNGEPVEFAKILLFQKKEVVTGAFSDDQGRYQINNLAPGTYDLKVMWDGGEEKRIEGIRLTRDRNLPVFLELGDWCMCIPDIEKELPLDEQFIFPKYSGSDLSRDEIRQISR